jgi:hypothetical protein
LILFALSPSLRAMPCAPPTAQTGSTDYSITNLHNLTHTTLKG